MKKGAEDHKDHIHRFSPGIEYETCPDEKKIAEFVRCQIIEQ